MTENEFWQWVKTGGGLEKLNISSEKRQITLDFLGACIGETDNMSCSWDNPTKLAGSLYGMFYRTIKNKGDIVEHMGKKYKIISSYFSSEYKESDLDKHVLVIIEEE